MASSSVATSHRLAIVLVLALGLSQLANELATGDLAGYIHLAPCPAGEYSNITH